MIYDRLAIGTANWGKPYGLSGVQVPRAEQEKILEYCQDVGINMIDTAVEYEADLTWVDPYFEIVSKGTGPVEDEVKRLGREKIYAYLGREKPISSTSKYTLKRTGVSLYETEPPCFHFTDIVQAPYSLRDRRFEALFREWKESADHWQRPEPEIHVRSVFLQGKLLDYIFDRGPTFSHCVATPFQCLSFVLMNPHVDRVVIGVDSLDQLAENLEEFHRMDSLKTDDRNITDPRRWKK